MPRKRGASREQILRAAEGRVRKGGARSLTVDGVASEAGCAKGLIHYHFKTKAGLLESVAERLARARETRWLAAFDADSPKQAIDGTWSILTEESSDGTIRAWTSLFTSDGVLPDRVVSSTLGRFSLGLGDATIELSGRLGLAPTVPPGEIGWLLGAVVHGMGFQLAGGGDRSDLEGAYAAAWLGILALFAPRDRR